MALLSSERLSLRALEPEDLDFLYRWENDSSIWGEGSMIPPFSRYDLKNYIANATDIFTSRELRLIVEENASRRQVGVVDLFDFEPIAQRVELGILIDEVVRGRGYAKETLEMVVRYVFDYLRCHQIMAKVNAKNEPSLKLFQEMNFTQAGKLTDWVRDGDDWSDCVLFQLVNGK